MSHLYLRTRVVPDWPKLAWVATFGRREHEVQVFHGPMVEISDDWIVEAAWADDFDRGDFDKTDLVFGTGIRARAGRVVFVSSGTVFDRLLYCRRRASWYVSNSLPALLAVTGLSLRDDYVSYPRDAISIVRGLENRVGTIPTNVEDVFSVFFNNLVFDGRGVLEEPKVDTAPHFASFDEYHDFLVATARSLGENAASPDRQDRIHPLSSISSGYDSCVAATISRDAGCRRAVTITKSTSLWRGSDSGAPIAKKLGMECVEYPRTANHYPLEVAIWAADGRAGLRNWTLFDYPKPLCLFFTGGHGETMWDRLERVPDPFVRRAPFGEGFSEFRLLKGVFNCALGFWGVRRVLELRAMTTTDEMRPWYMNKHYDKPIARRIVEQAGVPRGAFGQLNKNVSLDSPFRWPCSPKARESFRDYLRARGLYAPPGWLLWLIQRAALAENLLHMNLLGKVGVRKRFRPWKQIAGTSLLFQWANHELKQQYLQGLRDSGIEAEATSAI